MNQKINPQSKKIALVWHLDYPGGVQYCVLSLVKALNQQGIVPTVLWDHAPDLNFMQKEGVSIQFEKINFLVSTTFIRKLPVSLQYLFNVFNTKDFSLFCQNFDFIYIYQNNFLVSKEIPHVRYLSGPPLLPQLENPRKGILGVPYRIFRFVYKKFLSKKLPAYEFHRDNHYVINSFYTAELFEKAHGVRLDVVHPPISFNGRSYEKDDFYSRDTICYFSRITPAKRPNLMLDLASKFPARYVIMGGVNPQMESFLKELKLSAQKISENKIHFIVNPDPTTILQELSRTRFYIFPAINEHFGMTTPEAIASGAIPFVHDSGGQKEIVPNPDLRFDDNNYLEKFSRLEKRSDSDLIRVRQDLSEHIKQFSAEVYNQKMLSLAGL